MGRGWVVRVLFYVLLLLGHLKKIISFSSSWFRNLNAAGGNLIIFPTKPCFLGDFKEI